MGDKPGHEFHGNQHGGGGSGGISPERLERAREGADRLHADIEAHKAIRASEGAARLHADIEAHLDSTKKDMTHFREHERLVSEGDPRGASDELQKHLAQGSAVKETYELLEETRIKDPVRIEFLNRTAKSAVK